MASPGSEMEKGCVCPHGRSLTPGQGWGQPDTCGLSTNPASSCPTAGLLGPGASQAPSDPQGNAAGMHRAVLVPWACTSTAAPKHAWQNAPKEEAIPADGTGRDGQTDPQHWHSCWGTGSSHGCPAPPPPLNTPQPLLTRVLTLLCLALLGTSYRPGRTHVHDLRLRRGPVPP